MQNVFHRPLNSAPVTCLSTPLPVIFRHASDAGARRKSARNKEQLLLQLREAMAVHHPLRSCHLHDLRDLPRIT